MLVATGAPGCELQSELGGDADNRERLLLALITETEDRCVESQALVLVIDGQDQVIQGDGHVRLPRSHGWHGPPTACRDRIWVRRRVSGPMPRPHQQDRW